MAVAPLSGVENNPNKHYLPAIVGSTINQESFSEQKNVFAIKSISRVSKNLHEQRTL